MNKSFIANIFKISENYMASATKVLCNGDLLVLPNSNYNKNSICKSVIKSAASSFFFQPHASFSLNLAAFIVGQKAMSLFCNVYSSGAVNSLTNLTMIALS